MQTYKFNETNGIELNVCLLIKIIVLYDIRVNCSNLLMKN